MPSLLFYFIAAVCLVFGAAVVFARNPVTSALCLAVSFVGLAGLFISLDAYFLGILQVLVYAGAVMVLFLFIIMLMDVRAEESSSRSRGAFIAGIALAAVLLLQVATVGASTRQAATSLQAVPLSPVQAAKHREGSGVAPLAGLQRDLKAAEVPDAKLMGETLFGQYTLHLQIIGLLLVVATVGVVSLSRKDKTSVAP